MNVFVLDHDPALAATYQCDKHVVKMCLETAQLLCTPFDSGSAPYRRTHYNHPCAQWARSSDRAYVWLAEHGLALCLEYTYRFGKTHASERVIQWCLQHRGDLILPRTKVDPFVQVMPDAYKQPDPVLAYRAYYMGDKSRFARWTTRLVPNWYVPTLDHGSQSVVGS